MKTADMTAEMAREQASIDLGVERHSQQTERLLNTKQYASTLEGRALMKRLITPMTEAITKWVSVSEGAKHRPPVALSLIAGIDHGTLALLTVSTLIDRIHSEPGLQKLCLAIGREVELEVRLTAFSASMPKVFDMTAKNVKKSPLRHQRQYQQRVFRHVLNRYESQVKPWDQRKLYLIGAQLLDLLMTSTGAVVIERRSGMFSNRNKRPIVVVPTQETARWLEKYRGMVELLRPRYQAMLVPPPEWVDVRAGGFVHPGLKVPMIKTRSAGVVAEAASRRMPAVFGAVNHLQRCPWRINQSVLAAYEKASAAHLQIKDMPTPRPLRVPPKPKTRSKKQLKKWKMEAAVVFRQNSTDASRRVEVARVVGTASELAQHRAFFFVYQLDFRGRVYPVASRLHPQGDDLCRGLLESAIGEPLNKEGLYWLKVHAANTFGIDKVSFDERVAWASENTQNMMKCAADPVTHRLWTEADSPFQFLAACFALAAYAKDPASPCHLIVSMDGSCNGIQHLAALSRDAEAGAQVNLTPTKKPSDIYATVAARLIKNLKELNPAKSKDAEMRDRWLAYGINRTLTKRPVMVQPYGGTREACRRYIIDTVKQRSQSDPTHPFVRTEMAAGTWLSHHMWQAIRDVVVGPRQTMEWLQGITKVLSSADIAVRWTAPTGFPVQVSYNSCSLQRVQTKIGKTFIRAKLATEKPNTLDKRRQVQSVAPHLIHSLDAAALMDTVMMMNVAYPEPGLSCPFQPIHDSYGTLPNRVPTLQKVLRQCYVRMYETHDPLAEFYEAAVRVLGSAEGLTPPPPKGTLDIKLVEHSPFFFA